jgi:hypothetical protein
MWLSIQSAIQLYSHGLETDEEVNVVEEILDRAGSLLV